MVHQPHGCFSAMWTEEKLHILSDKMGIYESNGLVRLGKGDFFNMISFAIALLILAPYEAPFSADCKDILFCYTIFLEPFAFRTKLFVNGKMALKYGRHCGEKA